jgi:hypothetical protein
VCSRTPRDGFAAARTPRSENSRHSYTISTKSMFKPAPTLLPSPTPNPTNGVANSYSNKASYAASQTPPNLGSRVTVYFLLISYASARLMRFRPSANISVFTPMPMRK